MLNLASGGRLDPLIIAITTAGVMSDRTGRDSVCYDLYKHGCDVAEGLVDDPSFFFAWWGAPLGADHLDPEVWKSANPGYGDLIDPEDFESSVRRTPENEFRTKRLNQWVAAASAWFPQGSWMECAENHQVKDGDPVVLGFDGSFNNDTTALVLATVEENPHIDVVALWEKGPDDPDDWVVPVSEVEDAIRDACRKYRVVEVVCDSYRWQHSLDLLRQERLPMVDYPQRSERMAPATAKFYTAVMNKAMSHSGNIDLARHVNNAILKTDSRGSRLTKESTWSSRKIDLAVAAVMAFDRATQAKKPASRVINLNAID